MGTITSRLSGNLESEAFFDLQPQLFSLGEKNYIDCRQPYYGELGESDLSDGPTLEKMVPPAVKDLLDRSNLAMQRTRSHFPHGAANLQDTLHASKLQSYVALRNNRTSHLRDVSPPCDTRDEVIQDAAIGIATGGGTCGDYARVSAVELNKLLPPGTRIRVCDLALCDHALVVVGDGALNAPLNTIVDAWPTKSQAVCAADYGLYRLDGLSAWADFEADGQDLVGELTQRVCNLNGAPIKEAGLLPLEDVTLGRGGIRYYSFTHVTQNRTHICYHAEFLSHARIG